MQSPEPFWLCDWTDVIFLHFEVDAVALQREVPFQLDLIDDRALVSLVAFTLTEMRPRIGGPISRLLFKPFGTHRYLNVRCYVREHGRVGIYFLAEWLDAQLLNLLAGPLLYGLPFRCGQLNYQNRPVDGRVSGRVQDHTGAFSYSGQVTAPSQPALRGSFDEFLVERYRAFTCRGQQRGWFPVWHEPWRIAPVTMLLGDTALLDATGAWFQSARFHCAHWSPGAGGVWMGWKQAICDC